MGEALNRAKPWQAMDYFTAACIIVPKWDERCEGTMTEPTERRRVRPTEDDRREIAKRVFDALCAKFPEKYVALVQPRDDPTPAVEA